MMIVCFCGWCVVYCVLFFQLVICDIWMIVPVIVVFGLW